MPAAFGDLPGGLVRGGEREAGVSFGCEGLTVTAWEGNSGLLGEAGSRHVFGLSWGEMLGGGLGRFAGVHLWRQV